MIGKIYHKTINKVGYTILLIRDNSGKLKTVRIFKSLPNYIFPLSIKEVSVVDDVAVATVGRNKKEYKLRFDGLISSQDPNDKNFYEKLEKIISKCEPIENAKEYVKTKVHSKLLEVISKDLI